MIADAAFLGKKERALETKTFSLERPAGLEYAPGQYFFVSVRSADDSKWLLHHFTLSSSPTEEHLAFTTRMTGHPFKERIDALPDGATFRIDAPHGSFTLADAGQPACFVCGGIGITPARSIVRWALDADAPVDLIVLYANRNLESAAFREEFEAVHSDRIRIVNVLSEPAPGWTGESGHIDAALVRRQVPDAAERRFFVSGPPGMVSALGGMLRDEVGITPDRLTTEDFPGY